MIRVNSVSKIFDRNVAIDDISFELIPGKIFGLLGPNGAGKTTLIRMLLDIIKPDKGDIEFESRKLTPEDKNKIGYLPEERGLYKNQKVLDTLVYLAMLKGMNESSAKESSEYFLSRLNMEMYKDQKLSTLSKGMQQKIQFVATIMFEPSLVILDEPFSGLDPLNARITKELIAELKRQDRIIVLSTHQMNQVEELCDTVLIINKGKKVINGPLKQIREEYSKNELLIKSSADYSSIESIDRIIGELQGKTHLVLKNGFTSTKLIKEIINQNATIEHLEKRLIPLEDIFIKLVSEHDYN
jgi:ABC-2 type transport system ATP-binding protein